MNSSKDIKQIVVYLKKGSFEEHLTIFLTNPETKGIFISFLMAFFFFLLGKIDSLKFENKIDKRFDLMEEMIVTGQGDNLKKIYSPIEKKGDNLKIQFAGKEYDVMVLEDKTTIDKAISEKENTAKEEVSIENVKGYISVINIDTKKLRFHPEGETRSYPLIYTEPIEKMALLIGKPLRMDLRIIRVNSIIKSYEILEQTTKEAKLSDFNE